MNIDSTFGYRERHRIQYSFEKGCGSFTLWSFWSSDWLIGGTNYHGTFEFGGAEDVFGLLSSIKIAKAGMKHGFSNCRGEMVFVEPDEKGLVVRGGGSQRTGQLSNDEIEYVEIILKDILFKSGLSVTEITKRLA